MKPNGSVARLLPYASPLPSRTSPQRIDRIKSTLSSDLDHLFASTLHTVTKESKVNEMEKSRNMADLGECLRTYDVLGLWRDAEDVLKREVVREFIKKVRSLLELLPLY